MNTNQNTYILTRNLSTPNEMMGVLKVDNSLFYTIEKPWKDNTPSESCIPAGTYKCVWHSSPSKGMCYLITKVPNRSQILIHSANYASELLGCIALGMTLTTMKRGGGKGVLQSRKAMDTFHQLTGGKPFLLTIEERI